MNEFAHGQIKMRKLDTSLKCIDENYDGHTDQQMDMWSHGEVAFPMMSGRQGRDIYSGHFPPGGKYLSTVKNGAEFKGGLEKRKGKGGKRRKLRKE